MKSSDVRKDQGPRSALKIVLLMRASLKREISGTLTSI